MRKSIVILVFTVLLLNMFSCKDPENEDPTQTEIINEWIWLAMNDIYLWADEIDPSLYPTDLTNPEAFFDTILYKNDRFSWIVDDYQALVNSFNNIELSSGISPYFILISQQGDVISVVEYVVKESPADSAGIKRGDIITTINGQDLNLDNYIDLFYSEELTLEFADFENQTIVSNDRTVTISAKVIEENPVLFHDIIEYEQHRIGYIAYTGFSLGENNKWQDSLDFVMADLSMEGITDLVMDIRYNPGGRVSVAKHIASIVSPANVPDGENVFVNYEWNERYNEYFLQEEGEDSENLVVPFESDPVLNLNLENIYFLTSSHSASASELLIIGLDPYMNVTQIGESTYGKFYGSVTIPDTEETPRHTWAMQPIVFKFSNADGYTDFVKGLSPDLFVDDNMLEAKPFGDISDPVLAKALEEITGISPLTTKASEIPAPKYKVLSDPVRLAKQRAILNHQPNLNSK